MGQPGGVSQGVWVPEECEQGRTGECGRVFESRFRHHACFLPYCQDLTDDGSVVFYASVAQGVDMVLEDVE